MINELLEKDLLENQLFLDKDSSNEELIRYFKRVFELDKSGKQFPVDLDEVWSLVYARKDNAIRVLKENFIQGIDYQVFRKKEENPLGGRPAEMYRLSAECLDYFIARKIRVVFEVYRRATHEFKRQLEQGDLRQSRMEGHQALAELASLAMQEQERRIDDLMNQVLLLNARTKAQPDCFSVSGFAAYKGVKVTLKEAARIGSKAKHICLREGFEVDRLPDPRFGGVNIYPKHVLEELFDTEL